MIIYKTAPNFWKQLQLFQPSSHADFQKVYDFLIINPSQFRRHFFSGFAAPHPLVWSTSRNNLRPILGKGDAIHGVVEGGVLEDSGPMAQAAGRGQKIGDVHSLKRTASLPLKNRPKRKRESLPTIHFQGLLLLGSGKVYIFSHWTLNFRTVLGLKNWFHLALRRYHFWFKSLNQNFVTSSVPFWCFFFCVEKKPMERVKLRSSFGGVHQIQKGPLAANLRRTTAVNDGDGEVRHETTG